MKITADMLIEDIVEQYPETIRPMQEMGVQCMICGEPVWGTLEEKAREKGLDNLEEIVQRLNDVINSKTDKQDTKKEGKWNFSKIGGQNR